MLTVSIKAITAASFALAYQITNTDQADIYVADLVYKPAADGNLTVDPKTAYVIPTDDGTLYVGKLLLKVPEGMKVESTEKPYYRRLAPGESLAGEIVFPNPAVAFHPYNNYRLGENPFAARRIVVQIGVISARDLKPDEATLTPAPDFGPAYFKADYGYGLQYQTVLDAEIDVTNTGAAFLPVTGVD